MSSVVLDASALCALLFREPGYEQVADRIDDACVSVVNLTEFLTKAIDKGKDYELSRQFVNSLGVPLIPFEQDQAELAAALRQQTKHLGLSLGDRACLALGMLRQLPVLTTDKEWSEAGLDVQIVQIR